MMGSMVKSLALLILLSGTLAIEAQEKPAATTHFVIVLERGPNWLAGKSVSEQPLREHGRYLQKLMESGKLVFAGPFLDDQGGIILLKASSLEEAQKIAGDDPAARNQIMRSVVHPFQIAFDSATGTTPFKRAQQ